MPQLLPAVPAPDEHLSSTPASDLCTGTYCYKQRRVSSSSLLAHINKNTIPHIALAPPSGPEDADRSTCRMLDPTTTKTKNPSITGPTEKSFFFVVPASTAPRR